MTNRPETLVTKWRVASLYNRMNVLQTAIRVLPSSRHWSGLTKKYLIC